MIDAFEDHCWKDVVSPEVLERYARHYGRDVSLGPAPAVIAIDLYELVYQGGPRPVSEIAKSYPMSCGEYAWEAIEPTQRLLAAARAAGLPIFYSTVDTRLDSQPRTVQATKRPNQPVDPALFAIRPEFKPQPGDIVITKMRASAFYGTPLTAHLTRLGVQTVIMLGETTSGCLRASAVDAFSGGYNVVIAEECCYDRFLISHKINLFDLHHKYAEVMHVAALIEALAMPLPKRASG
jgi:nicotinamidase-related amidase